MVKRIFRNTLLFLDLPQGDILSAGFVIMFLSLGSGLLGLVRDRLLATQFTPDLVGIYFAAFVIPDNIFQILILSAVGAAFIPVFTKYEQQGTQWIFTRSILHITLLIFLLIIALGLLFTKPLSILLVPGLQKENPEHINLLVNLTRIILIAQPFFVLSYLCTGILQSYHRFLIPASASIFYNAGIILGILLLAPTFGMYGVAVGIILGAFLHFLIQLPFVGKLGFSYNFSFDFLHPGVFETFRLMLPRAFSIAIERAKLTVDTILASLISLSSITYLNFAMHVAVFPVSLVAAAIAQAALPFFAKAVAKGNIEEFKNHLMLTLTHIVFLLAPASVLLIVLHTPLVRLIFGAPLFSWEATVTTARTLAILSVGLIAQGAGSILARGFYAFLDTKTPLVVTLVSTAISIILSIVFVVFLHLDVRFLAVATTTGAIMNAAILFFLLDKKIGGLPLFTLTKTIGKMLFIAGLLGAFSYTLLKALEVFFNTNYVLQLLLFTFLVGIASAIFYLLLSFLLNLEEYRAIVNFFRKAAKIRNKLLQETAPHEPTEYP